MYERIIRKLEQGCESSFIKINRVTLLFVKLNELSIICYWFFILDETFNDILCTSFFRANKVIFLLSKKTLERFTVQKS